MKTHPGAASGTYSMSCISVIFDATTDTVTKLSFSGGSSTYSAASGTVFPNLHGGLVVLKV